MPPGRTPQRPPASHLPGTRLLRTLWICAALLVVAGIVVYAHSGPVDTTAPPERLMGAQRLLALDAENNLPTWFSTVLILSCALLSAWYASCLRERGAALVSRWRLIALCFLALSADEAAAVHEVAPAVIRRSLLPAWESDVIWLCLVALGVGGAAVLAVPVLRTVGRDIVRLWLLGGVLLTAAGGVDVVGEAPRRWADGLGGALLVGLEEALELATFLVFLDSLIRLLRSQQATLRMTSAD